MNAQSTFGILLGLSLALPACRPLAGSEAGTLKSAGSEAGPLKAAGSEAKPLKSEWSERARDRELGRSLDLLRGQRPPPAVGAQGFEVGAEPEHYQALPALPRVMSDVAIGLLIVDCSDVPCVSATRVESRSALCSLDWFPDDLLPTLSHRMAPHRGEGALIRNVVIPTGPCAAIVGVFYNSHPHTSTQFMGVEDSARSRLEAIVGGTRP